MEIKHLIEKANEADEISLSHAISEVRRCLLDKYKISFHGFKHASSLYLSKAYEDQAIWDKVEGYEIEGIKFYLFHTRGVPSKAEISRLQKAVDRVSYNKKQPVQKVKMLNSWSWHGSDRTVLLLSQESHQAYICEYLEEK